MKLKLNLKENNNLKTKNTYERNNETTNEQKQNNK